MLFTGLKYENWMNVNLSKFENVKKKQHVVLSETRFLPKFPQRNT